MKYGKNNKSQNVLFIYGVSENKSVATRFLTAYVLRGALEKFGIMKGAFTPLGSLQA